MIDEVKVINFIQNYGCAKIEHLQTIFNDENNNFKFVLKENMISQKNDIYVHNTKRINNNMLVALSLLCKFKQKYIDYHRGTGPVLITFLTDDYLKYNIVVADEHNREGIVKQINFGQATILDADRLILAFPDENDLNNIKCKIPFAYTTYPDLRWLNQ